jgi:lipopolysaccharide transport system ATP-binding protein
MRMRIAFAVATSIDPEIILMDEWIAVGDAHFMEKAAQRLSAFVKRAGLLVLASHSPDLALKTCNKGIMLSHGKVAFTGTTEATLAAYLAQH